MLSTKGAYFFLEKQGQYKQLRELELVGFEDVIFKYCLCNSPFKESLVGTVEECL